MQHVQILAETRIATGKTAAKNLRKENKIPAVIYGKNGVNTISTTPSQVKSLIYTPQFKLAEIACDGKTYKTILKEVKFNPITDKIEHLDFLEIVDGQKVNIEVPVKFTGTSPGVKAGGKLIQSLRKIKIKVSPENIIDHLELSISSLELGQSARVRDIAFPQGVECMVNPSIPVATIDIPRALKSAAAAAKKEEGKKKK